MRWCPYDIVKQVRGLSTKKPLCRQETEWSSIAAVHSKQQIGATAFVAVSASGWPCRTHESASFTIKAR